MKDNSTDTNNAALAEGPEVTSELSKVATNPKRNILILGVIVAVFGYLVLQLFSGDTPTTPKPPPPAVAPSHVVTPVAATTDESKGGAPAVPELPTLAAPKMPPPLSTDTAMPSLPQAPIPAAGPIQNTSSGLTGSLPTFGGGSEEEKKRRDAKKKASIILIGGTAPTKTEAQVLAEKDFTFRGDMAYVLSRGKIIDAVLESAVNTDFGGEIKAVIVRDVFAQDGKFILIPKGSQAFGSYAQGIKTNSARIDVTWNRIDLANGYSINLSGEQAVDNLGRAGVSGRLDNHYQEQFANAIMASAFNIAFASALDKIVPPVATSQTTAQTSAQSTQITNALASSSTAANANPGTVCAAVLPVVPTTSASFAAINAACTTATATQPAGTTPAQTMQTLVAAITAATSSLSQAAAVASTPTQTQAASTQAFKDVSKTVQDMVGQNTFKPTVTIDQGKPIKIYVKKDYVFPKAAVSKSRVIK